VPAQDEDQPRSGSVAPPPAVRQEGAELPIPDGLRASLPAPAGRTLRRLREHALSATSPRVQRGIPSTAIVSPLFCADAHTLGAESLPAAA
jgi:hypothetical protein